MNVYGRIGNDQVELNNAATDSTLRQLIQVVAASGNAQAKELASKISGIAGRSGLDVKGAQTSLNSFDKFLGKTGAAFGGVVSAAQSVGAGMTKAIDFASSITDGAGKASAPLQQLAMMGVPLAGAFAKLAQMQEKQLDSYRMLTTAGVNFGGSLSEVRLSASQAYMTLDKFTELVSKNGETFARMGGTADEGARAFVRLSNSLIKSPIGDKLMALGFTTDEINQNMVSYIAQTGGRTREELANTEAIKKATASYMTELDGLTSLTGKNRKEIEEESKKAAQNAAFQRKLATMGEEERAKVKMAMDKAAASGLAGATDLVVAKVLGIPPLLKDAQMLTAMAPKVAAGINNMTESAMSSSGTLDDVNSAFGQVLLGAADAAKGLGKAGDAFTVMGSETGKIASGLINAQVLMNTKGITTAEEFAAHQAKIRAEQETREKSTAAEAAKTQKSIMEMGEAILRNVLPTLQTMTTSMNDFIQGIKPMLDKLGDSGFIKGISDMIQNFTGITDGFQKLLVATALLTAAFVALKVFIAMRVIGDLFDALEGRGRRGGPRTTPVPTGGGGGEKTPPKTPTPTGGGGARGRILGGVGITALGMGVDYAGQLATEGGRPRLGAGLETAGFTATGAGVGAMVAGPPGALVGAAGGAILGMIKNYEQLFAAQKEEAEAGGDATPTPPVRAVGTEINEGELLETLVRQMSILNNQTAEILTNMRETADNTRRNYEATKRLDGNLFPTGG